LIERVGVARYNELLAAHHHASIIETVNGYPIREVHSSRFGTMFLIVGLRAAHPTLDGARKMAAAAPKGR